MDIPTFTLQHYGSSLACSHMFSACKDSTLALNRRSLAADIALTVLEYDSERYVSTRLLSRARKAHWLAKYMRFRRVIRAFNAECLSRGLTGLTFSDTPNGILVLTRLLLEANERIKSRVIGAPWQS